MSTVTLTTAQAIIRYLAAHSSKLTAKDPLFAVAVLAFSAMAMSPVWAKPFTIIATCLPLYRGQNEQSMGFAAAAYAKYHLRRGLCFARPARVRGRPTCFTAVRLAHANRLPMLMLCGDAFMTRLPDPVLQQLEHFGNPDLG